MTVKPDNLIWIDLEMTGLNTDKDLIIEIATIVTDAHLNMIAEGPVLAIRQSSDVLNAMDDWNKRQHAASGLIDRVQTSTVTEAQAEAATIEFLTQHVPPGKSPMCGNSICQDRRFLFRCMPKLEQFFHYRHIDVSTLKELALRWAPQLNGGLKKEMRHRALDDIRESIEELKFYRANLLKV
jgi:oligoribonuclease